MLRPDADQYSRNKRSLWLPDRLSLDLIMCPLSSPASLPCPFWHNCRASTRRERRYVVPEQTRQSIGAGQAEGREGAGVIVLQNNLNFNYFGELQKRRCDSLTVCHRKINWLLLLPSSSTMFRAYEPFLPFSLTHIYTHCIFLYKVILK